MHKLILGIFIASIIPACAQQNENKISDSTSDTVTTDAFQLIDSSGMNINTRFNPEPGFVRVEQDVQSFGNYLRNLKLKEPLEEVHLYNGEIKSNYGVYCGVVDLPIGKKDLHQCADAVMRLRAEYLWSQKRYDEIHFNFTNGFRADYSKWIQGKRISVRGNSVSWVSGGAPSTSYDSFWSYLEKVFTYVGTLSLSKELKKVEIEDMRIGDVFILGGSPGHAVIVVDMIEDPESGKKKFMLAQSYMPAQEIQILINPASTDNSPWYDLEFGSTLRTPEWTFSKSDLKRF